MPRAPQRRAHVKVSKEDHGRIRSALGRFGLSPAATLEALPPAPIPQTRAEIAASLAGWLRRRPRSEPLPEPLTAPPEKPLESARRPRR